MYLCFILAVYCACEVSLVVSPHFFQFFFNTCNLNLASPRQSLLVASVDSNSSDEHFLTPLHVACAEGNFEMVRLIVSHGSSVNRLDVHGHGPLWHAAQQGHGEIIQFLIQEGAVVNSIDQFGATPLHVAAENGHCLVVKHLLQADAEIIKDVYGNVPHVNL